MTSVPHASPASASGAPFATAPQAYDAILLAGFGGPEGQDDVIPFLRNVTRGRGIPDERLEEVAHHYRHFGGVSPINAQNRALKAALEAELAARASICPCTGATGTGSRTSRMPSSRRRARAIRACSPSRRAPIARSRAVASIARISLACSRRPSSRERSRSIRSGSSSTTPASSKLSSRASSAHSPGSPSTE